MKRILAGALALAFFLSFNAITLRAAEPPATSTPQSMITMNFQDVDIAVLAKFISEITGKNFVIDESVRGKVTLISPSKVTPRQAYSIFQSVLQIKGFTTVKAGPVIKIVPAREVRETAALTSSQQPGQAAGDEYVTRMVKLKNVEAASIVNVVQPMISHDGLVAAYPEANTLIITDDAWNVERLLKILGALDVEGTQQDLVVIPLKLAFADDISKKISDIMQERVSPGMAMQPRPGVGVSAPAAQAPGHAFKIEPDERTNSLIVLAPPLQMRQIKDLISKLDVRSPLTMARIHVYRLKNAQAQEIVSVIGGLIGGGGGVGSLSPVTGRGSLGRSSGMMGGGLGGFGGGMGGFGGGMGGYGGGMGGYGGGYGGYGGGMGGYGGGMGGFGGGLGATSGSLGSSSGSSGPSTISSGGSGGGTGKTPVNFEGQVSVTADPATNTLVISAAPQDYETLRNVIEQLDVPRRQVFVQAIVVEVSTNRERDLGINFQSGTNISNSVLGTGAVDFGQLQNTLGNPLGITGLALGLSSNSNCSVPSNLANSAASAVTGAPTTPTNITVPCDVALLTALASDTHSNILSAPTLLTADNEEANIVVGENLPFLSDAFANAAFTGGIFNSVDRQNVGITLDIVPQVTEGDYVRMDVYEEVSAVVGGTENSTLGPTTTIRAASTTVMAQNHRTTVIGGLISDDTSYTAQGVPFFSSIPVLGNLFSNTSRTGQKTNLIVFLTPHIIRNRYDLRALSLDQRQKFIQSLGKKEVHNMPASQLHQLYSPTFSISVPPGADLKGPLNGAPPEGATLGSEGSGASGPTPLNTEEIGPSSKSDSGSSKVAGGPAATDSSAAAASAASASTTPGAAPLGMTAPATATAIDPPATAAMDPPAAAAVDPPGAASAIDPPPATAVDPSRSEVVEHR